MKATRESRSSSSRRRRRRRRRGSITFEWIALVTILGIGVIAGLAVVRNALLVEYVELTETICDTEVGP